MRYIRDLYSNSTTSLIGDRWKFAPMTPASGVKQGDLLSPFLFNLVIDNLLKALPPQIAAKIYETPINALAFADDLVLASTTREGLQELLDITDQYLRSCALSLNPAKCSVLSMQGQPKQKCNVIALVPFHIGNTQIPSLQQTDKIEYLGIEFDSNGHIASYSTTRIREQLECLTKVPLKPQQRLYALKTFLIPRLYHLLKIRLSYLTQIDALIRGTIRGWLKLPADTPVFSRFGSRWRAGRPIALLDRSPTPSQPPSERSAAESARECSH